jgi:hypothetical protein
MSFPNIPNITPLISVTTEQTIPLLLSSIALEELALAHIINAEAEKLQFVLGTLDDTGTRTMGTVLMALIHKIPRYCMTIRTVPMTHLYAHPFQSRLV